MTKLTVIVTALCNEERLKYTLEGLCEQSVEDFGVLIVCGKTDENAIALAEEYTKEYVGFTLIKSEADSIPALRNQGAANAETELVWFIDGGDYISPDSVENVLKTYEETNADIITTRNYFSADGEPRYLDWSDMLATVPHIDRFDRALLNTLDLDGRVYKKKFFDLYSLRFPEQPVLYNTVFLTKCLFGCSASVAGVAGAIYDRRTGVYRDGFKDGAEPSAKTLNLTYSVFEQILGDIKGIIEEETGSFDGDEYTFQEMLFIFFTALVDNFYRYFWYLSDEDLVSLREHFESISALMVADRQNKIAASFADLGFPSMYMSKKDAALLPCFSLFADNINPHGAADFIQSLYVQKMPFFELFIAESLREYIPKKWLNAENLHILPDNGFFAKARAQCRGLSLNVKDASPFDPLLLSELKQSKTPKFALQYSFAAMRKKHSAKTYLKNKGLSLQ